MTLVLVGCLSLARVIPPPPNLGKLMDLNVNLELEQLVKSSSLVSFNELVDTVINPNGSKEKTLLSFNPMFIVLGRQ
jgi:hypothetical protein